MRIALAVSALIGLVISSLRADEPAQESPQHVIGHVYNQKITAGDVGLTKPIDVAKKFDARDREQWDLMGRILTKFGQPIMDRFIAEQKIEATPEEIKKFADIARARDRKHVADWLARVSELQKKLAEAGLSPDDKAKLEEERTMYERFVSTTSKVIETEYPTDLAKQFIVAWKTERDLHRKYGGGIIFQQAGLEALDARRLLFEEAEKKGDLKFDDVGVRHLFYYYANMKHPGGTFNDAKPLENPWFFEPVK